MTLLQIPIKQRHRCSAKLSNNLIWKELEIARTHTHTHTHSTFPINSKMCSTQIKCWRSERHCGQHHDELRSLHAQLHNMNWMWAARRHSICYMCIAKRAQLPKPCFSAVILNCEIAEYSELESEKRTKSDKKRVRQTHTTRMKGANAITFWLVEEKRL